MANIVVNDLTFTHEGALAPLFEHASFTLDTDWRLGFIGRNGRGKTTFLRLLMGDHPYQGRILAPTAFAYFPFAVHKGERLALAVARDIIAPFDALEARMEQAQQTGDMAAYGEAYEQYTAQDGYTIDEQIEKETGKLGIASEALARRFDTLSHGERTKLMLAALFLRKNHFLLIDEPTNHLDAQGRSLVARYLAGKKGFILVSHDRSFLDETVDHVLSINRTTIEVQQGNFSSWWENKERRDQFELDENRRLKGEIRRLSETVREKAEWSEQIEATKIGGHTYDRGRVGHLAARMMQRAKAIEARKQRAVEEKSALLHDIDEAEPIKLIPLAYHKERLLETQELSIAYGARTLFSGLTFSLARGERVAITGANGCGKSSLLKLLCGQDIPHTGQVRVGSGMLRSLIPQGTEHLRGSLAAYLQAEGLDQTLVKSLLRKLDFARTQFDTPLEAYSEGQKKKLLLAASLSRQAHLYVWDEPLNYVDVLSRMQIEALLLRFAPTLLFVEHDRRFCERIATRVIAL